MRQAVVIFDLDGTLTKPILDFDAIRAEIGGIEGPILEALASLTPGRRAEAECIVHRHEQHAMRHAELHDGAVEVLQVCRDRGYAVAIHTRNARRNVERIIQRFGIVVDTIRTREDGAVKPSPEGVLSICAELGTIPTRSWMVGDYLFDILSGQRAGTRTVLMVGQRPAPAFASRADHVITELRELLPLLESGRAPRATV